MADKILGSDIVDQSVEVELLKVDKLMDNLLDKFIKTAAGAKELNTALKNAGSTNEVTKGVNGYSASLTELDKIKRDLVKANEKLIASQTLEAQLLSELKSRQVEENKTTREFIRDKKMQEGSIDQLNAKLVQMKRAYTELAQAERDAAKGQQMLAHIQATRTEVGKLEATMGMYHKNVGNYTNATFQMTQVLREVPNFAQSAEIGIRSLSNNLPMLADAFQQVRKDAGGTGPALKIFASSIMSFSGLFPIAMTLLIKYQDEIGNFIKGLFGANEATKTLAKSQTLLGSALLQGSKDAVAEVRELDKLYKIATDVTKSTIERKNAVAQLQKLFPQYYKDIKEETFLNGGAKESYDKLRTSIIANARAKAIEGKIQEVITDGLEKETDLRDDLNKKIQKQQADANKPLKRTSLGIFDVDFGGGEMSVAESNKRRDLDVKYAKLRVDIFKKEQEEKIRILELAIAKQEEKVDENFNTQTAKSNTNKALTLKAEKKFNDEFISNINELDREVQLMGEKADAEAIKRVADRLDKIRKLNEKYAKDELDLISGNIAAMEKQWDDYDKEDLEKQKERLRAIADVSNALFSAGSTINDALGERDTEKFRLQEEQMNTYYDAEEERIKQSGKSQAEQQEALMKLAAQREAQQKKIDADRAQAQRKAAARQKVIDIAQVIANTALAVTAALTDKTLGPIGRAAAAIAAGITGTAQLAAIIATPLPQYKDGTDSHKGGFAVVGDGGEHELIVEPSGKSYLSPNKSTIMNLPAKTKVIPQKKLLQMVTDATHVSLANTSTPITEGMYINEMIAQYDKLASKVDRLSNVMESKNMQTNIYSDYDHNLHVQRNRF